MLGKTFNGVLRLDLEGGVRECRGPGQLDALLTQRLSPSPERLAELVALTDRQLYAVRTSYLDLEADLENVMAAWATGRVADLDDHVIPDDHGWHNIMRAVIGARGGDETYRGVAVERYRQYLRGVLQCLEGIARGRLNNVDDDSAVARLAAVATHEDMPPQRLLFDLQALGGEATGPGTMARIPKGEPVTVRFGAHQSLPIRLAQHDFTLVSGSHFLLIDDTGCDHRLAAGRAVLGRGAGADLIIAARYRSVSRKHLVVECEEDGTTRFTDISSMGTYLPSTLL